jgi:deoxycytidine triphosphate deaminase
MILTYDQIKEAQEKGDITIDPFDERLLQGASYDLRVGKQGATPKSKRVVDIGMNLSRRRTRS